MKRTVTRWVDDKATPQYMGYSERVAGFERPIDITYDDGDPEGKCPCESLEPSRLGCCRVGSDNHCACCKGYGGDRPCLSDWHKKAAIGKVPTCKHFYSTTCPICGDWKAEPATRDRATKWWLRMHNGCPARIGGMMEVFEFKPDLPNCCKAEPVRVSVIIHEPVEKPCATCSGTGKVSR